MHLSFFSANFDARVIDSQSNLPIARVEVKIPDAEIERETGDSGVFHVLNLTEGPHTIELTHPRYQPASQDVIIVSGETTDITILMTHI